MKIKQNNFHSAMLLMKANYTIEEVMNLSGWDDDLQYFSNLQECDNNNGKDSLKCIMKLGCKNEVLNLTQCYAQY